MFAPTNLQRQLEVSSGKKIQLKINNNRSTMLSVRWESDCTKVSLHKMFLQAPPNIMDDLACYLRSKNSTMSPHIKLFIDDNLRKLDYSHLVNEEKLSTQGSVYNLQHIFNEINNQYFKGKLPLRITWYGKPQQRNRTRVTFGLYCDPLKLVKINRILDNSVVPEYVIWYVVYHEMLHYVIPSYRDSNGLNRIHSKEFKEMEKKFRYYHLAQRWIKENHNRLFRKG